MKHAFEIAKELGCTNMNIGIVEENEVLRNGIFYMDLCIEEHKSLIFPVYMRIYEKMPIRRV